MEVIIPLLLILEAIFGDPPKPRPPFWERRRDTDK